ncbi:hypothetical protein SADUNF_Sadunf05G0096000 [Salix dunnii]|uniref:LysM domain receptor-like kinase 4 n=1 Tax=Salix dunnii TaxID=1413687 RepID=A0A835K4G7_9ROSI|nr:hypothetical protein SADUNF_Sadunf05G0096000 [Salix dunnii]
MSCLSVVSPFVLFIVCCCSLIQAQQPYVGKATTNCSNTENSALGYSCNGLNKTCQAYLIFRSQPRYNNVASISTLLGSDPSQLSEVNSVSETKTFASNQLVIVPVNCSCSGEYSQANTSYIVQQDDSLFVIANNTYQGLTTCQALRNQRSTRTDNISSGETLTAPLRCACPTKNQSDLGIRYLLSYLITPGDTVSIISEQFSAETGKTLEANGLTEQNPNIFPYTTLLIPLQNTPTSSQTVVPPPPPASPSPPTPSPNSEKSSNKTWIYVVVGVVGGIALVIGTVIFFMLSRKSKKQPSPIIESQGSEAHEKPLNKKLDKESQDFFESLSSIAQSIKVYKFEDLKAATDNFSPSCWIKGSVYRGLINGDFAAIKKMNGDVSKEINLLSKINHSNLIRLSGVCFNDCHWYLIYEYAANGPLSDWIYDRSNEGMFLNWTKRIQIASDVAMGLDYLHSFTNYPHVHKDIKSSNILLDSDLRAKIAKFALARSTDGLDGEFALTRHIVGTKGYMAPEYLENGLVSTKLDVYAFGVLTLEIITGKEVAALYREENRNLSDVLNGVLSEEEGQEESLKQLIDPSLHENYPSGLALLVFRLIGSCLNKNPGDRPTMDEIMQSLSSILTASLAWEMSYNASGYHISS